MGFTGAAGATGPSGPAGIAGATGPAGANGAGVFGAALINPVSPNTLYYNLNGANQQQTTNNPEFAGMAMPVACTFDRLVVTAYGVSGGGNSFTVTLVKNGTPTTLACTVLSATASLSTCSNISSGFSVVLGDLVALKVDQASGVPIVRLGIGTRCN
jgi:hypothetical protein